MTCRFLAKRVNRFDHSFEPIKQRAQLRQEALSGIGNRGNHRAEVDRSAANTGHFKNQKRPLIRNYVADSPSTQLGRFLCQIRMPSAAVHPGTQTAWPTGQRYAHQTLVDPRKGSVEAP